MTGGSASRRLVGGIVAYGDGARVVDAIRSLLRQRLPIGATWSRLWVVVAPDAVGTAQFARAAAAQDPRVEVVEEAVRRGKAAALEEIFRRADGDLLVLLNGDGVAEPGAVRDLVRASEGMPPVFGVMARPVPPPGAPTRLGPALDLLWGLHDRFHSEMQARAEVGHLSDELLLLPIAHLPPLRPGIINDGAFCAAWVLSQGGALAYARSARVRLAVPAGFRDHLEQRRRILVGHRQVRRESGRSPSTLAALAVRDPGRAWRLIRSELRGRDRAWRSMALLLAAEGMAAGLASLDLLRQRKDYGVWPRVGLAEVDPRGDASSTGAVG